MATVLRQPRHEFNTAHSHYSSDTYDPYTGQYGVSLNSSIAAPVTTGESQLSYTSPQRWAAQQVFNRRTSKSPNTRERTPIRHNRPEMSKHRNGSRNDMLLAYAEEHARQAQQGQIDGARTLFVPTMGVAAQSYHPNPYTTPIGASPYMYQQPYFDSPATATNYAQLVPQQNVSNSGVMYAAARQEMPPPQLPAPTLNPTEILYSQPRVPSLLPIAPVPSNFPPDAQRLESVPDDVELGTSRQKPQCWDHGCNGRQFSTFSNLLRHQREKSGTAMKARCPHCGTEFTRTTARNGHMYGGKCKGVPDQIEDTIRETKDEVP